MKIYVSATFRDLQKHWLAVLNILCRTGHHPIGVEDYVAEVIRPLNRCLKDLASCDAYLCIVAWPRLYFLCSLTSELTTVEVVVFKTGLQNGTRTIGARFIGTIHPRIVKERLASQYDKLRQSEQAVAWTEPESDLVAEMNRRASQWTSHINSNGMEAHRPVFVTDANLECWFTPCLIRQSIEFDSVPNVALRM